MKTDLDFYHGGVIRSGFPNGDALAYMARCLICLETMPEFQFRRLEAQLDDAYGIGDEHITFNDFQAHKIYLLDPASVNDLVFIVSGYTEFEPEHGISFTVRNGIILCWDYEYRDDDPYCENNEAAYQKTNTELEVQNVEM